MVVVLTVVEVVQFTECIAPVDEIGAVHDLDEQAGMVARYEICCSTAPCSKGGSAGDMGEGTADAVVARDVTTRAMPAEASGSVPSTAWRDSFIALPRAAPVSGSFPGPRMSRAITRMMTTWTGESAPISAPLLRVHAIQLSDPGRSGIVKMTDKPIELEFRRPQVLGQAVMQLSREASALGDRRSVGLRRREET